MGSTLAGGIKGHPLDLEYCNEGNDPNKATACARQFVSDHIVSLVGSIETSANDQVTSILAAASIA